MRELVKIWSTDTEVITDYSYAWYLQLNNNKLFVHLNNFELRIIYIRTGDHTRLPWYTATYIRATLHLSLTNHFVFRGR